MRRIATFHVAFRRVWGFAGALVVFALVTAVVPGAATARTTHHRHSIVQRCRGGDPNAWVELVEGFSPYIRVIATRDYGLDRTNAEDVSQEVFARTYEHIDRVRDDEAIRPWIAQLTRRLCIDRLREDTRVEPRATLPNRGADDPALTNLEEAALVHEALGHISAPHRTVLSRVFLADQSYVTIADALDVPVGTVSSRISRALTALRDHIGGLTGPTAQSANSAERPRKKSASLPV